MTTEMQKERRAKKPFFILRIVMENHALISAFGQICDDRFIYIADVRQAVPAVL